MRPLRKALKDERWIVSIRIICQYRDIYRHPSCGLDRIINCQRRVIHRLNIDNNHACICGSSQIRYDVRKTIGTEDIRQWTIDEAAKTIMCECPLRRLAEGNDL